LKVNLFKPFTINAALDPAALKPGDFFPEEGGSGAEGDLTHVG
jgi:hypothetical protein